MKKSRVNISWDCPFNAGSGFTLILTSDRFYLIRISWVPYMTLTPPPPQHWLMAAKWKIWKNWLFWHFTLQFRCQTFLKTYSESLFQGGSGHIFNFFLRPSWAEKTCLESHITDPRGFAAVKTGFYHSKTSRIRVLATWSKKGNRQNAQGMSIFFKFFFLNCLFNH